MFNVHVWFNTFSGILVYDHISITRITLFYSDMGNILFDVISIVNGFNWALEVFGMDVTIIGLYLGKMFLFL